MNPIKSTEYLFNKDLAANIVYAEARHFAAGTQPSGPTEEEIQTLTRRLSWLIDRDLRWTDVEAIVSYATELRDTSTTENARRNVRIELFWEIVQALGDLRPRYEVAA